MALHDPVDHGQSQAGPVGAFGGEKRFKTALPCFRRHAGAGINDPDADRFLIDSCVQPDFSSDWHKVQSIEDEVRQDPTDCSLIAKNSRDR